MNILTGKQSTISKKGTVQIIGNVGKRLAQGMVAGAYMKKGILLTENSGGHVGADMEGGIIYSKKKANIDPSAKKGKSAGKIYVQ